MFIWDEDKSRRNKAKHGLDFDAVHDFSWGGYAIIDRSRDTDDEERFAAIGLLHRKLYTVILTYRGDDIRIISLRRANKTEEKIYAEAKQTSSLRG